jgi:hypothetical protein
MSFINNGQENTAMYEELGQCEPNMGVNPFDLDPVEF